MLPRASRLPRAGFASLSRAKRASTPHFLISLAPAPRGGGAAVVPKKVATRSVDRHLMKRRLRAIIAPWVRSHTALLVTAKGGANALPYRAMKEEIEAVLGTLLARA